MRQFNPFRLEGFCAISLLMLIWAAALSAHGVAALGTIWVVYVILYSIVNVIRDGLRGLTGPTLALFVVMIIKSSMLPLLGGAWCICALFYLGRMLVRFVWRLRGPSTPAQKIRKAEEFEPVAVAVPMPATTPDAQNILKHFGLIGGASFDGC